MDLIQTPGRVAAASVGLARTGIRTLERLVCGVAAAVLDELRARRATPARRDHGIGVNPSRRFSSASSRTPFATPTPRGRPAS